MAIDRSNDLGPAPDSGSHEPSAWRRLVAWLQAFDEAMDTSYDDIQDRRILVLEREVAGLKARLGGPFVVEAPDLKR